METYSEMIALLLFSSNISHVSASSIEAFSGFPSREFSGASFSTPPVDGTGLMGVRESGCGVNRVSVGVSIVVESAPGITWSGEDWIS